MKQTDFFFSSVVDLKYHSLSEHNMNAMYVVYGSCKAINQPNKYGSSIQSIIIDAIHQDYASRFHRPAMVYDPAKKTIEAAVKVDLNKVLASNFVETVAIYEDVIFTVLDQVKEQVEDFDTEKLKSDLKRTIKEEIRIVG